jgi:hypothetical protein
MNHLKNIINYSIVFTLKSKNGLYIDLKGKTKFNREIFNKDFNKRLPHGSYPAHIVKKMIDDALYDLPSFKEYQNAKAHLDNGCIYHDDKNCRRLAYGSNVSQLLGF